MKHALYVLWYTSRAEATSKSGKIKPLLSYACLNSKASVSQLVSQSVENSST